MAWRDNLRSASYRGVGFFVEEAEQSGGRRTVTHEYPLRDVPYVEDMGLKARTFTISAYVIGDDYMTRRDALISALEGASAGLLVHPYLGTKQAICSSFTIRETREDGRMARFSITLEEAAAQPSFPLAGLDYKSLIGAAADTSLLSVASSFLDAFNTGFQPQFALDSIEGIIRDFSTTFSSIFGRFSTSTQSKAVVTRRLNQVFADAPAIIRSPILASSTVSDVVGLFKTYLPTSADTFSALESAYSFTSGVDPSVSTATRMVEVDNRKALIGIIKQNVAVESARAAIDIDFASYDDAITARDSITRMLDSEADIASDEVFLSLMNLRKEVVRGIPGDDRDLPRILDYTPVATLPSLVISHRLYGSTDKESDIIARNRIRHPGFVLGGRPLEVIADA